MAWQFGSHAETACEMRMSEQNFKQNFYFLNTVYSGSTVEMVWACEHVNKQNRPEVAGMEAK